MIFAIINTDSYQGTALFNCSNNRYDQTRAHGVNILELASKLGVHTILDVGEVVTLKCETSILPDIYEHSKDYDVEISQCSLDHLSELKDCESIVVFVVHYFITDENRTYLYDVFNKLNSIIYYTSDNEYYYRDYFLNELMHDNLKGLKRDSLKMILSGHAYSSSFNLGVPSFYLPMIPNLSYKKRFKELPVNYDIFINCHHHSKILSEIFDSGLKFKVFSNESVGKFIERKFKGKLILSKGSNTPSDELTREIMECQFYFIPNTYHHIDPWYVNHYNQVTMYTHKMIEAFYADRIHIGDLPVNVRIEDVVRKLPRITRTEYYERLFNKGIIDPIIRAIKYTNDISPVICDIINKYK